MGHGEGAYSGARDLERETDGRAGRSGSRYGLGFERPSDDGGHGRWRIDVDDAVLCAVDSAESAVRRAEGLATARSANRAQLLHSARSLRFVTDAIRKQCSRREREDGPPASLLAH
jgi:hypothetical protein